MKEMTVYNILSSLEPEQEEQAFYSLWGRGDERKTAPDAAVCFGVPTIPSFPVRPSDPPPPLSVGLPPASLLFAFLSLEWMKTQASPETDRGGDRPRSCLYLPSPDSPAVVQKQIDKGCDSKSWVRS